jgi:hypothetical protein
MIKIKRLGTGQVRRTHTWHMRRRILIMMIITRLGTGQVLNSLQGKKAI